VNDDDRPIYSDVGYFTRGRPGVYLDPEAAHKHWRWSLAGIVALIAIVVLTLALVRP
jgi:hypothetical protein